jgi:hypothetical protein
MCAITGTLLRSAVPCLNLAPGIRLLPEECFTTLIIRSVLQWIELVLEFFHTIVVFCVNNTLSIILIDFFQFWELELRLSKLDPVRIICIYPAQSFGDLLQFEYKYLIKDDYGNIVSWEGGHNRRLVPEACSRMEQRDSWHVRTSNPLRLCRSTFCYTLCFTFI